MWSARLPEDLWRISRRYLCHASWLQLWYRLCGCWLWYL